MATMPSPAARFQVLGGDRRAEDMPTPAKSSFGAIEYDDEPLLGNTDDPQAPKTPRTTRRLAAYGILSMLMLTLQGTTMSIVLRYSRIQKGTKYLPSVAVFVSEIIKLAVCVAVQVSGSPLLVDRYSSTAGPPPSLPSTNEPDAATVVTKFKRIFMQALPMALPATMFAFQQVLLIAAATHLDAVTYQIFNQAFKLIPTALFAWWLLGQRLEPMQWASIPVLASGVILVTINNSPGSQAAKNAVSNANWWFGMVSCCVSGLSSAFAGVYFERYVKGRYAASLWVRNIQLSAFGVPFSACMAWIKDGASIRKEGWLQGFSHATWAVVGLQVFGGLVTGMVVKYCDNILKNFSLAVSVILTVLVAIPLFGQYPSPYFLVGVSLVLFSVFMYGKSVPLDLEKGMKWIGERIGRKRNGKIFIAVGATAVATGLLFSGSFLRWMAEAAQMGDPSSSARKHHGSAY